MTTRVDLILMGMGFEDGFREFEGVHELKVGNGWDPWWLAQDARPEYKIMSAAEYPYRVFRGQASQCWFNNFRTHTAGIQRLVIGLPVGVELVFTAWAQAWTRIKAGDPRVSDGRYRSRLGIDPYGGSDPESKDVVWSEAIQPYDAFYPMTVRAISKSDRARLWIWGQPEWPGNNNDLYLDECELYYLVDEGTEPGPVPPPTGEFDWERLAKAFDAAAAKLRNP